MYAKFASQSNKLPSPIGRSLLLANAFMLLSHLLPALLLQSGWPCDAMKLLFQGKHSCLLLLAARASIPALVGGSGAQSSESVSLQLSTCVQTPGINRIAHSVP